MIESSNQRLLDMVKLHEGERLDLYQDSKGIYTIGVGHNLEEKGISPAVSSLMLQEDLGEALDDASKLSWFDNLNEPRQAAIVDLIFNMGLPTFLKFRNTISLLEAGDYEAAGDELLVGTGPGGKSRYYADVGIRAERISNMIKTGEWQ